MIVFKPPILNVLTYNSFLLTLLVLFIGLSFFDIRTIYLAVTILVIIIIGSLFIIKKIILTPTHLIIKRLFGFNIFSQERTTIRSVQVVLTDSLEEIFTNYCFKISYIHQEKECTRTITFQGWSKTDLISARDQIMSKISI